MFCICPSVDTIPGAGYIPPILLLVQYFHGFSEQQLGDHFTFFGRMGPKGCDTDLTGGVVHSAEDQRLLKYLKLWPCSIRCKVS